MTSTLVDFPCERRALHVVIFRAGCSLELVDTNDSDLQGVYEMLANGVASWCYGLHESLEKRQNSWTANFQNTPYDHDP